MGKKKRERRRRAIRSLYAVATVFSIAGATLFVLSATSVGTGLLFLLGIALFGLGAALMIVTSIVRISTSR